MREFLRTFFLTHTCLSSVDMLIAAAISFWNPTAALAYLFIVEIFLGSLQRAGVFDA